MTKPVIIFAFANEQESGQSYLRNLPLEINQLDRIVGKASDEGLCDYKILTNATLQGIFEVFRDKKYRDRIAIFHFSGHADSWSLMLESDHRKSKSLRSDVISDLFADQRSLQLVFLNGCFSIQQAEQLREKGLPACIGTVSEVADQIACELSIAFYSNLTAGLSIDRSWKMATQEVSSDKDTEAADLYYRPDVSRGPVLRSDINRFPWEMLYRDPNGEVLHWNLPSAAGNPLFGLPPVPTDKYPLPNEPFRFLGRYSEKDAGVFFGRGEALQQLYSKVTATLGSPLVLLYGQSGVGKSSLIHAGLVPRLANDYEVIYLRREAEKGLMLQLFEALGIADAASSQPREDQEVVKGRIQDDIRQLEATLGVLEGDARQQVERLIHNYQAQVQKIEQNLPETSLDLAEKWGHLEEASGKKGLILFVDQVEEVITRPNEKLPNELDSFLNQARLIFEKPEKRPKGKLVLSYRKEYQPEILKAIKKHQLLKEEYFLTRLDKKGVIEIITGLTSTEQLRDKYNLNIDPGLPLEMANNLVSDPDSPIAPILQIILTKLWQAQEGKTERWFRVEDYRQLQEKGILLNDFFNQQMEKIAAWELKTGRPAVSSGLALDVLNYHTTRLSTAESRDMTQLRMVYQHQNDLLDELINEFKQHYLLSDTELQHTALAHDTLAPIVHRQMRDSDKPGQRALRILETKVIDFIKNPDETIIEEEDLGAVEEGKNGMRTWMPIEEELIEKSRDHRAALQAYRLRNKRIRLFAVVAITLLGGLATWLWLQSEKRARVIANDALFNEGRLEALDDPVKGLAKMRTAYLATEAKDTVKLESIYKEYRSNLFYQTLYQAKDRGFLKQVAFSSNGKYWAASTDRDNKVMLFDAENQKEIAVFDQAASTCTDLLFTKDDALFIGSADRNVYLWQWQKGQTDIFGAADGAHPVKSIALSPDGNWLLVAYNNGQVATWELATPNKHFIWPGENDSYSYEINAVAVSLDGTGAKPIFWVGTNEDGLWRLDEQAEATQVRVYPDMPIHQIIALENTSKLYVLIGTGKIEELIFDGNPMVLSQINSLDRYTDVTKLAQSSDNRLLIGARRGGKGFVWDISKKELLYELKGHRADIHSMAVVASPDRILTGAADTSIRQWNLYSPYQQERLQMGYYSISSLAYSPDGLYLGVLNSANEATVWERSNAKATALTALSAKISSPLIFSEDGRFLAMGDEQGRVHLFDPVTCQKKDMVELAAYPIIDLAWSGTCLVALHENGHLSAKNYPNGSLKEMHDAIFSAIEISADGHLAALASGKLWLLGLPDLLPKQSFSVQDSKWYGLIAGSKELVLQADGETALVFNWATQQFDRLISMTATAGFSSDKTLYSTASLAPCSLELRTSEGYLLQELNGDKTCQISAVAVHPSGKQLVAGTQNGELLFWENGRAKLVFD